MALLSKPSTLASLRLSSSISPIRISSSLISSSLRSSSRPAVASIFSIHSPLKQSPAGNNFAINKRTFSNTPIHQFSPSRITMAGGNVVEIKSNEEFKEKVTDSKDLIVVDCFADWCGPCKAIAPKVEEYSKTYTNVKFYSIDVDELSEVAQELGIRAMPTFILFKDGEKVSDVVGANPPALEAGIKALSA